MAIPYTDVLALPFLTIGLLLTVRPRGAGRTSGPEKGDAVAGRHALAAVLALAVAALRVKAAGAAVLSDVPRTQATSRPLLWGSRTG